MPADEKYSVNVSSFFEQVHSHHRIESKINFGYMTTLNSVIQFIFSLGNFQVPFNITGYRQIIIFWKQDHYIIFSKPLLRV